MNEKDWNEFIDPPERGHYLVQQETKERKKYRWVRYWDGVQWSNAKEEQYGPIVLWAIMPPVR